MFNGCPCLKQIERTVEASPVPLPASSSRTFGFGSSPVWEVRGVWGVFGSDLDDEGGGREEVCPKNQGPSKVKVRVQTPAFRVKTLQFGGSNDPHRVMKN